MAISFRLSNALFEAIKSNNKVQLENFIQRGINLNFIREKDGSTPLHSVAKKGNIELAKMLLDAGASIDTTDQEGSIPLHVVAGTGAVEVARLLLDAGSNIHAINDITETPLHLVLKCYNTEKSNTPYSDASTPFYRSKPGKIWVNVARLLLDAGSNISAKDDYGNTPLHLAAVNGNIDVAQFLIEAGADIHATDNNLTTPFHRAVWDGEIEMARFLLDAGANIHTADVSGDTPFHTAAETGDTELARFLLEAGAVINGTNNDGHTALHITIIYGKIEVARFLIKAGADINAINEYGKRPLHIAFFAYDIEFLRLLFDAGVDINATITEGAAPFHEVARNNHFALEQRRIHLDLDLDFETEEDRNVLYLKHMVKLKCLGLHISDANMSYLMEWFDEELRTFEKECEAEVAGMKRQEIREDYRFCLCDVMTKGEDVLRELLHVEEVRLKLEEVIREMSYPLYGNMITMKFEGIVKTIEFSVKARPIIGFIVNSVRSIPDECVKMIASYFTDKEMKDLVHSFK